MTERTTISIQVQMKNLDDVFHNMIIALERLETFLACHRSGEAAAKLATTGMHSARDLHDYQQNPLKGNNKEAFEEVIVNMLGEVQLQCSALFYQTEFDDEKLFKQTMKYFMSDLLEWYAGRDKEVPYDEVEMCILPILVSLSRQVDSVLDIMQVFDEYVAKLPRIEDFSDEQKRASIEAGFIAFLKARHYVGEQLQEFVASGKEVELTVHRRGTVVDGYNRLMDAMLSIHDTTTPAKKVRASFTAYLEGLPEITDDMLEARIVSKNRSEDSKEHQDEAEADKSQKPQDQSAMEDEGAPEIQKQHKEEKE